MVKQVTMVNHKSERVLIIKVKIENEVLLLINFYNTNTENQGLSTLSDLSNMLEKTEDTNNKSIVFGGYFNLFFEAKLEAHGGNCTKEKIFSKTIINKRKNWLVWYLEN